MKILSIIVAFAASFALAAPGLIKSEELKNRPLVLNTDGSISRGNRPEVKEKDREALRGELKLILVQHCKGVGSKCCTHLQAAERNLKNSKNKYVM